MTPERIALTGVLIVAELAVLARAVLRPHRDPTARLAWVIAIIIAPVVGMVAYLLLGEARIGARRRRHGVDVDRCLPRPPGDDEARRRTSDCPHSAPFAFARSVNGLDPTSGNAATLSLDSNEAIDAICADIEAARTTVHLCTYIWLDDGNGRKLQEAAMSAARRGVEVRLLADALGSRALIASARWKAMADAGCAVRVALPVGNPLWTLIKGRVDLRNHRKLVVIDNAIAWCGSQNAADPEFRVKPRYAPWVDLMTRWEGPVARHWQFLFVSDWMAEHGEDLSFLLAGEAPQVQWPNIVAQVVGTGPTLPYPAMSACFAELVHSARTELVITTPYFVPDEEILSSLLSAARRGVRTRLLLPRRNDSRIVAAASKSYYRDLLESGVELYEYERGLLHAKTMIVDGRVGLIGSANLDRRSFELNFENNILFDDVYFARLVRDRQDEWMADCRAVTRAMVDATGVGRRLLQNSLAMFSPLL